MTYQKTFYFKDSYVHNYDVNYVLDQVFGRDDRVYIDDNNDTLVYLDPPYGLNSSDYSNLYRFSEEFL